MRFQENVSLQRASSSSSSSRSNRKILPSNYTRSSSTAYNPTDFNEVFAKQLVRTTGYSPIPRPSKSRNLFSMVRSFFRFVSLPILIPTCRWMNLPTGLLTSSSSTDCPSLGRKVTGTLFGHKRGHVSFAVQEDPGSEPVLLLELATSTSMLVKEMATGLVRIALECERIPSDSGGKSTKYSLFQEPMWTMYCNGKKCGYAISRTCRESDWHVFSSVPMISAGAGVIPPSGGTSTDLVDGGDLMYMRAKFERVIGNRDSEAYYMMNPDGMGGPELSIFLLRI